MENAVPLARRQNCLFLTPPDRLKQQRADFERSLFLSHSSTSNAFTSSHSSSPVPNLPSRCLILVDRPVDINDYHRQLTSKSSSELVVKSLDGLLNLDAVEEDWREALEFDRSLSSSPSDSTQSASRLIIIVTSCNTMLGVLTHGFCALHHFACVYVPAMPSSDNGHPANKILRLHYDPVLQMHTRIVGWDALPSPLTSNSIVGSSSFVKEDGMAIFAMTDWTERIRHCRRILKCHPIILEAENNPGILSSESDSLSHHSHIEYVVLTMPLQRYVRLRNHKGPVLAQIPIEGCTLLDEDACDSNGHGHGRWVYVTRDDEQAMLQLLPKIHRLGRPKFVILSHQPGILATVKAWLHLYRSVDVTCQQPSLSVVRLKSGAMVHPETSTEALLRYSSYVTKTPGGQSMQLLTVPVRGVDAAGHPLPHAAPCQLEEPKDNATTFVTQITFPTGLHGWCTKVLGRPAGSRLEAQQSACHLALLRLLSLGLVTEHLMPVPEVRTIADLPDRDAGLIVEAVMDNFEEKDDDEMELECLEEHVEEEERENGDEANIGDEENQRGTKEMLKEVIPDVLIVSRPLDFASLRLYVLDYQSLMIKDDHRLPLWSRILQCTDPSGSDFLNSHRNRRSFGLLLPKVLPVEPWLPTQVALGPSHTLTVRLLPVDDGTDWEAHWHQVVALQPLLFGLLNVRPLSNVTETEVADADRYDDLLKHTAAYFVVPLRRPSFKSHWPVKEALVQTTISQFQRFVASNQEANTEGVQKATLTKHLEGTDQLMEKEEEGWRVDWDFVDQLLHEEEHSLPFLDVYDGLMEAADGLQLPESLRALEQGRQIWRQALGHFALTQWILTTPYNGLYYRYRKEYPDLTPDSPFQGKLKRQDPDSSSMTTTTTTTTETFWEYVLAKYFPPDAQLPANTSRHFPGLLGVSRLENFADISQWVLQGSTDDGGFGGLLALARSNVEGDASQRLVKKRKKNLPVQEGKSALIPQLVRISPLPYWLVRSLFVVPKVAFELERQLVALQFYQDVLRIPMDDSQHRAQLAVQSLAASTAGLPYDYERLEVLGDALLKLAVSLDLMAGEPRWGEGRLSQRRQQKICNTNLYGCAMALDLTRYGALTPFMPKLWCPPGILALIEDGRDKGCELRQSGGMVGDGKEGVFNAVMRQRRLLRLLFDPLQRWRLLATLEGRSQARRPDEPWTLHPDGRLVPPPSLPDQQRPKSLAHGMLRRYGMAIPAKFASDLMEAVVGAVFEGHGLERALELLVHLQLCSPTVTSVHRSVLQPQGKLHVLGSLIGDPRDRLPLTKVVSSSTPVPAPKRGDRVEWGKLPIRPSAPSLLPNPSSIAASPHSHSSSFTILEGRQESNNAVITVSERKPPIADRNFRETLRQVEACLRYSFKEPVLLQRALTHSSHDPVHCMERLEWLGDAVLDWLVTIFFYKACPRATPAQLTECRKSCVNNVSLSEMAVRLRLPAHLSMAEAIRVKVAADVAKFTDSVLGKYAEYRVLGKADDNQGSSYNNGSPDGADEVDDAALADPRIYWELAQQDPLPPKLLGDLLEAVLGALFIDLFLDLDALQHTVDWWLCPFLRRHVISSDSSSVPSSNPISKCLEMWAKLGLPRQQLLFEHPLPDSQSTSNCGDGKDSNLQFRCLLKIIGRRPRSSQSHPPHYDHAAAEPETVVVGTGSASTRILAKQLAASAGVDFLRTHAREAQRILQMFKSPTAASEDATTAILVDPSCYRSM